MVSRIPAMVDMRRSQEETKEDYAPSTIPSDAPAYPYGLCISLTEKELEKLGLLDEHCEPGDMIHLHCMATVTSCSENKSISGEPHCRVELQITHITSVEDESDEDEEAESTLKTLYH